LTGGGETHLARGGPTVVKYNFSNMKLVDKHFLAEKLIGKYQISKSRGAACCHALSFIDVLQLSCDISSLLSDHIKYVASFT